MILVRTDHPYLRVGRHNYVMTRLLGGGEKRKGGGGLGLDGGWHFLKGWWHGAGGS
jgi:hypothetical protein